MTYSKEISRWLMAIDLPFGDQEQRALERQIGDRLLDSDQIGQPDCPKDNLCDAQERTEQPKAN